MKWFWIILAIAYIVSPYDLIPDFIPVRGWIDDLVVFFLLLRYLHRNRTMQRPGGRTADARQGSAEGQREQQEQRQTSGQYRAADNDPHDILGVPRGAGQDEIRSAYRQLANQYHPDKVAHLGKEFQELAEKRFKDIQQAYEQLVKRR